LKGEEEMALIGAEKIGKNYQVGEITVRALKGVSFTIEPASFVSFVGPSGSGKTTLLNLIGCLDKPTEGNLMVAGSDVIHLDRNQSAEFRGTHLGFIFQDFNLIPVLTVFENIEYPLLMVQKVPGGERKKRVLTLLEAVGMIALVTNPQLVLADEPTANLDHATAYTVIELMKKMKDEFKTTFVFSTHDQKIVGEAEVIYRLEDGELIGKNGKGGKDNG
jgi:putative ABC transport system ATP-binding protein